VDRPDGRTAGAVAPVSKRAGSACSAAGAPAWSYAQQGYIITAGVEFC
jgi:hypothetical protein